MVGLSPSPAVPARPARPDWAALLKRVFDVDVLTCARCGGRLRLIATVDHPHVIREILAHLGLTSQVLRPDPPQPPPAEPSRLLADVLA